MKLLVTGAAGRIGAHLTRAALRDGHDVRGLIVPNDPRADAIRVPDVELVEGDLRDRDLLRQVSTGVDAIVHLAGALTSRGNTDREFIDLNVNATFDLLVAAREVAPNLQRFVYASSDAVYADGSARAPYLPLDESCPVQPGSVYGASKAGAEQLCLSFFRADGFPATVCRFGATCDAEELIDPASVFARWLYLDQACEFLRGLAVRSPQQDDTLRILERLVDGSDPLVALAHLDGTPECRQWADARDIAEGCLRTLGSPAADGEIFDLAGADPFTTTELAGYLAERIGRTTVIAPVPTARPAWYASSNKARTLLGYQTPHTVFTMIDETLAARARP